MASLTCCHTLPLALQDGYTALMNAAEKGHLDIGRRLIAADAEIDAEYVEVTPFSKPLHSLFDFCAIL